MRRREFIAALGGAAAWPVVVHAQQSAMPVVGFLCSQSPDGFARYVAAFRQGLKDTGYIEGHNVTIEYRWADGQDNRLPTLAADLVARKVALIAATGGTPAAAAAKALTATIPIVFETGFDPVQAGLVASINRPGGNLTGVYHSATPLGPKLLELLHELRPNARTVAVLVNRNRTSTSFQERDLRTAAIGIGQSIEFVHASSEHEIETAFSSLASLQADALLVASDPFFNSQREQIVGLAAHERIPAIYPAREMAEAGGLMSYAVHISSAFHQVGIYCGRILKGDRPGDLPVTQVTKIELVLNLRTAKVLGVTFPLTLLARADEVIE
jgi:putative tryptophan/tyrosine transport system substrate-binding protein